MFHSSYVCEVVYACMHFIYILTLYFVHVKKHWDTEKEVWNIDDPVAISLQWW